MVTKLVNQCLSEYANEINGKESIILQESIKYVNSHSDPSGLIGTLCKKLPYPRSLIIKVIKEASNYKNKKIKICNIAEEMA